MTLTNTYIKLTANKMLNEYKENGSFNIDNLDTLLYFAENASNEIYHLIHKFYDIVVNVASNGGAPVLKSILAQLESEEN